MSTTNSINSSTSDWTKVDERVEVYRYDNGYMVEVGGRDSDNEWVRTKLIFSTAEEAYGYAKELHSSLPIDK